MSSSRQVASSRARLAALMAVSCVAGATDSVMSPYLCPLVRARTGAGASLCGLMISARFATHIVFVLVLGQAVARLGAARMLVTSALLCGLANMLLASVELVTPATTFTLLCFTFLVLSMVADSGVFCSIYVLAAQATAPQPGEAGAGLSASGPAWVETLYGCGAMLGPPLGGLIFSRCGFGGVILLLGATMATAALGTWWLYTPLARPRPDPGHEESAAATAGDTADQQQSSLSILASPVAALCCVLQISSGTVGAWYLSSLQSHLSGTLGLATEQVGLVYMCPSLVYTLLTPLVGHVLDTCADHVATPLLYLGLTANILGYLLLGPSSLLSHVSPHVASTVAGLVLIGVGQATCLITCLTIILRVTRGSGREGVAGKVTSVWECCEMVGGYLGSVLGGVAADTHGFRAATTAVLGLETGLLLLLMPVFSVMYCRKVR